MLLEKHSSPQGSLPDILEWQPPPLENGQQMELSTTSEHLGESDSMKSTNLSQPTTKKRKANSLFVIAESHQVDKKKTCNDKSTTCKKSSQTIPSCTTLAQGLISTGNLSEPSWSCQAKVLSKKLWLPTVTDSVGLPLNCVSGSFISMESNSWFSMKQWIPQQTQNLQKTCLPSLTFSTVESMAKESTRQRKTVNNFKNKKTMTKEKLPPNKVRKYRLHVNPETASVLKKWFGSVRLTYNWALSCIKRKPKQYKLNVVSLRKRFINKDNIPKKYSFLLDTPKHVRDSALIDLVAAFKTNYSKRKEDPNFKFEVKYRSKKENQAFTIPSIAIKLLKQGELKFYPQTLKNVLKYHTRNTPLNELSYDCKLTLDKLGRFYLIVPQYSVTACENQASCKESWVALDPGVRAFQTAYSPTFGISYKFGDQDISRIFRLCKHLDKLVSIRTKDYVLKQSITKLRNKIQNLVKEVHCKVIHFLTTNFQNIIIPPFNVSQMIKKGNRKISSNTVRKMVCWSHYAFRQRLLTKAKEVGVNVYVLGEEYTTKTCTNCMKINHKVKAEKVLYCPHCHVKVDRDVSGARNIFLKNIASWDES